MPVRQLASLPLRLTGSLPFLVATVLVGAYAALLLAPWIVQGHSWFIGPTGRPAPTDFAALRVAGDFALRGEAADAYDWQRFSAAVSGFVGLDGEHWLGWLNPPNFLLIIAPLALLPFQAAALLWVGATGFAYVAAARAALPRAGTPLLALAAPAAFACILKGQSGLLSAALIGFGLMLLDRRPVLAGICIGLLAYKPHFGLMLPLLLAIGGHWRCIAAAAVTVVGQVVLSAWIFGAASWLAFVQTISGTTDRFLVQGHGLSAMQSVYGLIATSFGPASGLLVHSFVALAALIASIRPWRAGAAAPWSRAAAGIAVTFLATPYAFNHDAPMLTIAALLLAGGGAERRPSRGECAWLGFAVLLPIVTLFVTTNLPGLVAAVIILFIARRQAEDTDVFGCPVRLGRAGPAVAAAHI